MNNKLMLILCRICGEQMDQDNCNHIEEERALTRTWVSDEILKAVEKRYEIKKVYEIWSYQIDRFDKNKKVGGLFIEMMNMFIKMKEQASGWSQHCTSDVQRHAYMEEFFKMEDDQLGENQAKTKIVNDPCKFFGILTNPTIIVNSVFPINEETLIVHWEYIKEACKPLATVNVVIASYVTAQARLKLHSYLNQLGNRVLYFDTDSVNNK
ncbi:hypothetical protein NQ317_017192, partial [Molorchus minor]